jgi:hypothetical protein
MKYFSERPPYLKKFVTAFILGTIIFISVFLFGYSVSYYKLQDTVTAQEDLRYQLLSLQVEEELLGNSCSDFNPLRFLDERIRLGSIISVLEERLGKTNPSVLEQKKTYSIIEAKHFIYVKNHNENCENKVPVILFFYSNKESDKEEGSRLGYMITTLNNKRPDIMVYSFDFNLDSSLIKLLKEKYKINAPNMLVINEKTPLNVFDSMEDIEKLL